MTALALQPVRKRKFPWWIYWLLLLVIIVFMISPIIPVSISESLAKQHGCVVHEGFANPCIVDGKDIGNDLYTMGMMGWFFLATAPIGLFALLIWLVGMIVHRVVWGRRNTLQAAAP